MKKILFLAPFPTEDKERDGYVQRIKSIDFLLEDYNRIYLSVRGEKRLFYLKINEELKKNVKVIETGHFFAVLYTFYYLFFMRNIYIHNLRRFSILYRFLKYIPIFRPKIVLDLHGVVPEEMKFLNPATDIDKMNKMEKFCFSVLSGCVHVTESMKRFYQQKYPQFFDKIEHFILGIKPHNLNETIEEPNSKANRIITEYQLSADNIIIVYSGGLQKWQKIDEMLSSVSRCNNSKVVFIFLTGNKEELKKMIDDRNMQQTIYIDSVSPNDLSSYYEIAHYGFALRDESPVNDVANPTKIIEYLYYGLTPIVDFIDIGDFKERGYNYIERKNLDYNKLINVKNANNIKLAKDIIQAYDEKAFVKFIHKIFEK